MHIRTMGAELFQVDGQTDRQTDRQTLSDFANAPINKKGIADLL